MARLRHIALMVSGAAIAAGAITFSEPGGRTPQMQSHQPAAESIAGSRGEEPDLRLMKLRMVIENMKRSMQQDDEASEFLGGIGNAGGGVRGIASAASYEEMLAASAHALELVPADQKETEAAVSEALSRKDSESIGRLASIVIQTLSIEAQSQACSAIESLALEGSSHAGIALAQAAPFVIGEEARAAAFDSLEAVLGDADDRTRKAMLETLAFHLRSGPLTHWSLSGDRLKVLDLIARFE